MYAKYIDRKTVEPFFGRVLFCKTGVYVNPTPKALSEYGYLPVLDSGVPNTGKDDEVRYEIRENMIIRHHIVRNTEGTP